MWVLIVYIGPFIYEVVVPSNSSFRKIPVHYSTVLKSNCSTQNNCFICKYDTNSLTPKFLYCSQCANTSKCIFVVQIIHLQEISLKFLLYWWSLFNHYLWWSATVLITHNHVPIKLCTCQLLVATNPGQCFLFIWRTEI